MKFNVKFEDCQNDINTYTDEIEFDTTTSWDWEPQGFIKNIEFEYGTLSYHWTLTDKRTGESFPFIVKLEVDSQDYCEDISSEDSYIDLNLGDDVIGDLLCEEICNHPLLDFVPQDIVIEETAADLEETDSNWELKDEFIDSLLNLIED